MSENEIASPGSLTTVMSSISDWRVEGTRLHALSDVLVIAACAMLCGRDEFTHMEKFGRRAGGVAQGLPGAAQRHPEPRHLPQHVCAALGPAVFLGAFGRWTQAVLGALPPPEGVVAIDGKALRGARLREPLKGSERGS